MFIRSAAIALLAVVPTGFAQDHCKNKSDWRIKIGRDRPGGPWMKDCNWVARKRWNRCLRGGQDLEYPFAKDACPGACDPDCVFECRHGGALPTVQPGGDDENWFFLPKKYQKRGVVGNKHRDCKWAARNDKCGSVGLTKLAGTNNLGHVRAFVACCESCHGAKNAMRTMLHKDGHWVNPAVNSGSGGGGGVYSGGGGGFPASA